MMNSPHQLTTAQIRLLQVLLLPDDAALTAWGDWSQALADLDLLDDQSALLAPMLYRRLHALGIDHPWMSRLKGMVRKIWYENQLQINRLQALIEALQARINQVMLLGSVSGGYDTAYRTLADTRMMINSHHLIEALDVLAACGYQPVNRLRSAAVALLPGAWMRHETSLIELRWSVLPFAAPHSLNEAFWERARRLPFGKHEVFALSDADQLLYICVCGEPTLWALDAGLLLQANAVGFDWPRLLSQAEKHQVVVFVREALQVLSHVMPVVPQDVSESLASLPVPEWQMREYQSDQRGQSLANRVQRLWFSHLRQAGHSQGLGTALTFPIYLLQRKGLLDPRT